MAVPAVIGTIISPNPLSALEAIGCLILPDDVVEVSTPVAGIVGEVFVRRGDNVTAGQVLAKLDTDIDELSLALAQARAADTSSVQARRARFDYLDEIAARLVGLAAIDAVSAAQRDEAVAEASVAEFELDQAEAALELLRLEAIREAALLEQKTLRSPVDGVITEQLLSPGEFRDGQSQIATIAVLRQLKVEAFAPLDYFGKIAVGDHVTIRPEAPVGGTYPADVVVIDQVFDAATATFGIEMKIDNAYLSLPAGLRCSVIFKTPQD